MTRVRALLCAVGSALLFGAGCGGPVEEPDGALVEDPIKRASTVYSVCWPALGVYSGPSTAYSLLTTLHSGSGNNFNTDSSPFMSAGEYWVRGATTVGGTYGYVRWAGLCH